MQIWAKYGKNMKNCDCIVCKIWPIFFPINRKIRHVAASSHDSPYMYMYYNYANMVKIWETYEKL